MVFVKVPATTANLGPGFDLLGLALQLYDEYSFNQRDEGFVYHLVNADAIRYGISSDPNNLVYRAFCHLYSATGRNVPGIEITCKSAIPICRGLGSSAAAVVAGLVGANRLEGNLLTLEEMLQLATELEGHPDNVAPAIFGGLVVSLVVDEKTILQQKHALEDDDLRCVLVVPDFTLETRKARAVLPEEVPFKDALFNMGRSIFLVSSLLHREYCYLKELMEDRLHQPYRQSLIPGFSLVKEAGLKAGAYGVVLSGAGPTLLAITPHSHASQVGQAMVQTFATVGVPSTSITCKVHNQSIEN